MIGLLRNYLSEKINCIVQARLLKVNETQVVEGIGVGGLEFQFSLEFRGRFRPMLPTNIRLPLEVVRFKQSGISLERALKSCDSMGIVADFNP